MIRTHGGGFLNVAATTMVRFAPGQAPPMATDDALDTVLDCYGPWASHALWDYCRVVLLQAAAGFPLRPPLEIPVTTPEPVCVTRAMQRNNNEKPPGKPAPPPPGDEDE